MMRSSKAEKTQLSASNSVYASGNYDDEEEDYFKTSSKTVRMQSRATQT